MAGMEPSGAQLEAMTSVSHVLTWALVPQAVQTAVAGELGFELTEPPRSLACFAKADLETAVKAVKVEGVPIRPGFVAKVVMGWDVARKATGVEKTAAQVQKEKEDATENQKHKLELLKLQYSAAKPASVTSVTTCVTVTVSQVLDQMSEVIAPMMSQSDLIEAHGRFEKRLEGEFPREEAPTDQQLSALSHVIGVLLLIGYADFAVFGPHGNRLLRKLVMCGLIPCADGTFRKLELRGPPDFQTWLACFRVLRAALIMLGYVGVHALDQYERHIARLHAEFGSQCWPLLYQADTRMRNEQFIYMRRELTVEAETIKKAGGGNTPLIQTALSG